MKKMVLKLKIIFTNLCRVIISFLFVNLIVFGNRIVFGMTKEVSPSCYTPPPSPPPPPPTPAPSPSVTMLPPIEVLCYAAPPAWYETETFKMFIILVPIAIVIIGSIIITRKIKKNKIKNSMEEIKTEEIKKDDE